MELVNDDGSHVELPKHLATRVVCQTNLYTDANTATLEFALVRGSGMVLSDQIMILDYRTTVLGWMEDLMSTNGILVLPDNDYNGVSKTFPKLLILPQSAMWELLGKPASESTKKPQFEFGWGEDKEERGQEALIRSLSEAYYSGDKVEPKRFAEWQKKYADKSPKAVARCAQLFQQ
eukprot:TRINITY_DN19504_c0_g1_i1.p2 TRINITY_DN19504_c0_g1~~TRINITY_DN19504_c0_g1_i1.p2  ORF type:complete len:177 (+),score=34.50 TRINITY_DN19504_c0_g1_i1:975-1505(+)